MPLSIWHSRIQYSHRFIFNRFLSPEFHSSFFSHPFITLLCHSLQHNGFFFWKVLSIKNSSWLLLVGALQLNWISSKLCIFILLYMNVFFFFSVIFVHVYCLRVWYNTVSILYTKFVLQTPRKTYLPLSMIVFVINNIFIHRHK